MTTVHVIQASGSTLEEAMANLANAIKGPKDSGLLGLGRKPQEIPAGRPAKPDRMNPRTREAILLTVRRDLTTIREKLLKGSSRKVVLGELDYTIDALDNALAEL